MGHMDAAKLLQFQVRGSPGPASSSIISQKDSENSAKPLYSWLWFIIAKGHILRSAKGRGSWGRVQAGSTHRASSCLSPVEAWTELNLPKNEVMY